jgi:hypothetical protein
MQFPGQTKCDGMNAETVAFHSYTQQVSAGFCPKPRKVVRNRTACLASFHIKFELKAGRSKDVSQNHSHPASFGSVLNGQLELGP